MPNYRRLFVSGGTYFLTLTTHGRAPTLTQPTSRWILRGAIRDVRLQRPFDVVGCCLLPDHVHCLWRLPPGDSDFSTRVRLIKAMHTLRARRQGLVDVGKRIWQARFWERAVRNEAELRALLDYVHYNPVKHGYVDRASDWPWSTYRRYADPGAATPLAEPALSFPAGE